MQRKKIKLGERLETVKSFLSDVPENGCIADIGTDHGKLVCAYLEEHEKSCAIATDISKASLGKARILAEERCLLDRVSFREGNGLSVIEPDEADAVCFCGMGGEIIRDCLTDDFIDPDVLFVFQPMRGIEELRQFLYENRFHIVNDVVVKENEKYYQIFSGRFCSEKQIIPKEFPTDFWSIGYVAFLNRDAGLLNYIEDRIPTLNQQARDAVVRQRDAKIKVIADGMLRVLSMMDNK